MRVFLVWIEEVAEDIATESRDLEVRNEIGVNEDEKKALTEMKKPEDNRVID